MRKWIALAVVSASAVTTLALGVISASASTTYKCTRAADDRTATATVRTDASEDYLEAHGFTCTGD